MKDMLSEKVGHIPETRDRRVPTKSDVELVFSQGKESRQNAISTRSRDIHVGLLIQMKTEREKKHLNEKKTTILGIHLKWDFWIFVAHLADTSL